MCLRKIFSLSLSLRQKAAVVRKLSWQCLNKQQHCVQFEIRDFRAILKGFFISKFDELRRTLHRLLGNSQEPVFTILGARDPGAVSGGGKSPNGREKNSGKEKSRMRRRAPGDKVLTEQFQTVGVILASDWCQKTFVFFCPITEQQG